MIDKKLLLDGCKRLMKSLEDDLIARSVSMPEVRAQLQQDYEEARKHKRTAQNFEDWRSDYATQQAAAWVLSAVFVRFLEDNGLVSPPRLAGPGEALTRARDQQELYFREHPTETDREYLLHVFRNVAALPGGREIFGPHNPVFELPQWLSGDAAGAILQALQRIDANSGALVHDFTDPAWDTRFLGDLYQDLSEAARKKYALLQTPEFVEEFILDRTLDPALDEFGLEAPPVKNGDGDPITAPGFRMIDPACGSGHFLLGAFRRILDRWQRRDPGANPRELVQRALNSVHGVDINPFAIAIARFRLLIQALQACGVAQLKDAPAFHFSLAAGDSLLHGAPGAEQQLFPFDPLAHHYQSEDIDALRKILRPGTFHAVVANPPYITVKDKLLNNAYRERYGSCHGKYHLSVPFLERLVTLCISSSEFGSGYLGAIVDNQFSKQQFGKKFVESYLPKWDLTHIIDTAGAYIPGHGTPTIILFARSRQPISSTVRVAMGISGEPSTPKDPSKGQVWTAILNQIDKSDSETAFISTTSISRDTLYRHPWSLGGGGASALKTYLDKLGSTTVSMYSDSVGITCFTLADDIYVLPRRAAIRHGLPPSRIRPLVEGDRLRDWRLEEVDVVAFPYEKDFKRIEFEESDPVIRYLWPARNLLAETRLFGGTRKVDGGLSWYEFGRLTYHKLLTPLSITYAAVSTHNHFVLDSGGSIFKQSAPIVKLGGDSSKEQYLSLLGLLNSSTACFWFKQVCHNKGSTVDQHGARQRTMPFEDFFDHSATNIGGLPIPLAHEKLLPFALRLHDLGTKFDGAHRLLCSSSQEELFDEIERVKNSYETARVIAISLQEELDWKCYCLFGLLEDVKLELQKLKIEEIPGITLGERAFEIVLARKMAAGEITTTWFARHGSTPITEIPARWPEDYRALVQRRIDLIESNKDIGLIERPEYKRRWNTESWDSQQARALRGWLLDRLESYFDFDGRMNESGTATARVELGLCSVARLADVARSDSAFEAAAAHYTGDRAFDAARLVSDLVLEESVPHLPVLRYKPAGLRKREEWEKTWALQRAEDALDARVLQPARPELPKDDPQHLSEPDAKRLKKEQIGDIPVPPKYGSGDFLKTGYWKLRGKLDVPKERWVSFPHGEGQDGTLLVAWGGYDHLQLARALSAHYVDIQERLGGRDDPRLVPLLASLAELIPWLKQWHNDLDPEFNMAMGDYFEGFVMEEARGLGMTVEEVKGWVPVAKGKK